MEGGGHSRAPTMNDIFDICPLEKNTKYATDVYQKSMSKCRFYATKKMFPTLRVQQLL